MGLAVDRLPPQFDAWFAQAVAREPTQRFKDAGAAWSALASIAGRRSFTLQAHERVPAPAAAQVKTGEMALARTLPHTGDLVSDDDAPSVVPVSSPKWPYALVAAAFLLGGGVFMKMHASSASDPTTPSATVTTTKPDLICPDGMAAIGGGKLAMGSADGESDERPVHDVQLNAFCIDLSEVTVAQYDACAKEGKCTLPSKAIEWSGAQSHDHAVWDGFCNEGKPDRSTHPMNCVTWEEARVFCKNHDKRLPSEEEWEMAARGTTGRVFPWGGDAPFSTLVNACGTECAAKGKLLDIEWSALYQGDDGWVSTAPVRTYPAGRTPDGVFDLGGNVSEWTASAFCPYPGTNCTSELKATRGSSWTTDVIRNARGTSRAKASPAARTADLGFRCAK